MMFSAGLTDFFQLCLSGFAVGCVYAIVALGFVIIYKATDVFNFAQGELMTLGAFICYLFIVQLHIPIILAFLLTFFATALIGMVTEEIFLRPMVGEPIFSVIMITVGLSVLLKGIIGLSWGYMIKKFPSFISEDPLSIAGMVISPLHLTTIIVTAILIAIFAIFFKYSKMGIAMRAVASDQDASLLMGISVRKIFGLSWSVFGHCCVYWGHIAEQYNHSPPIHKFCRDKGISRSGIRRIGQYIRGYIRGYHHRNC